MKSVKILTTIIIIAFLLFGCSKADIQQSETNTPEQTASGGIADAAENINVKDIDITQQSGNIIITISMLSGSRQNGYPESKLVKLPEYEIVMLSSPERLMITLENISFWDYEQKDSWALGSYVAGLFREVPANNDSLILYVQLTDNALFEVEETDGDLVITLTPDITQSIDRYYCVVDAFLEHQEGKWPEDIKMTPVLCSDTVNKLLISEPFASEAEAKEYMAHKNLLLESAQSSKKLSVISLKPGTLPNYDIDDTSASLENYSVILKEDVVVTTPAIIENGKYLDTAVDGRIVFSRSYKPDEPSMEQDMYLLSEKLWILDTNGRITQLDVSEFFSVEQAVFSYDGTKLAILDVSIENSVLYVYDFDSERLYNLGEEGFGSLTECFAWSDEENTVYAMAGSDTRSIQLKGCGFTQQGPEIFTVEEAQGSAGTLAVSQGRIFFADRTAAEGGIVYEIGETRNQLCTGADFKISSDGKSLVVLESYSAEGEDRITNLKLCDIETLECSYVIQNTGIEYYDFSQNLSRIYYTTSFAQNALDDYQYEFVSYDIVTDTTQTIALCSTTEFVVSQQPGIIYFIKEIIDEEQNFFATFEYDLN